MITKMALKKQRESGIELLKIFAIFLICISHVTQTLYTKSNFFDSSYIVDLNNVTSNIHYFILSWMGHFGALGNIIFFICSSWFLIDSKKVNKNKIIQILANVWIINIILLLIFKLGNWYNIPLKTIIKCMIPTTFELNWYLTYYLIFYCIHTLLNKVIFSLSKEQLLKSVVVMLTLYFGINFLHKGHYAFNNLICFIVIYFTVSYMKLYLTQYTSNIKFNVWGLTIGIAGTIVLMILTNFIGTHISIFSNKLMYWNKNNSPFILLTGISLFNLFRHKIFINKGINYISSLSLLIYIIHENLLVRQYLRPTIWKYIYENFGYNLIIIKDLCFAFVLFICSAIIALIYVNTLQKIVYKICDILYKYLQILYSRFINILLKVS